MGKFGPGAVVLVRFPFSDLSASKLRPDVVVAHAGAVDWVLCQVTSHPYGDKNAVPLQSTSFSNGGLSRDSFVRPGKLFTGSDTIVVRGAGVLSPAAYREVIDAVTQVVRSGLP